KDRAVAASDKSIRSEYADWGQIGEYRLVRGHSRIKPLFRATLLGQAPAGVPARQTRVFTLRCSRHSARQRRRAARFSALQRAMSALVQTLAPNRDEKCG